MKHSIILSLVSFLLFASCGSAATLLVPSQYPDIQSAIDAASNGHTIIVAPGTYTGNHNIDFKGKAITLCSQDGPSTCIIDCQNIPGYRGFYFHSGETPDSILSGFTITRGNISGMPAQGAGIYISASSPTIENCVISNNKVRGANAIIMPSDGYDAYGAGIYCDNSSHPVIENCVFTQNQCIGGDALFDPFGWISWFGPTGGKAFGGGIYGTTITVRNCLFTENTVEGGTGYMRMHGGGPGDAAGAGIYCGLAANINNCTVTDNSASGGTWSTFGPDIPLGAGIHAAAAAVINNCIVWANIYEDEPQISDNAIVTNCDVQDGYTGTGNINQDPLFVTGPLGDYYLSQIVAGQAVQSPCVNAGSGSAAGSFGLGVYTTRTDGIADDGIVDMGYHYHNYIISSLSPDIDENFHVDIFDFAILAADWLNCGDELPGDLTSDGCVYENDLLIVTYDWLECYISRPLVPNPADNATGVVRKPVLHWVPEIHVLHHDVYFGTSLTDVNTADTYSPLYRGRQDSASWDSASVYPDGFPLGTVCYWRIDEAGPACTTKGRVWKFTIAQGGAATNPNPANTEEGVSIDVTLTWTPDAYAISHDVYFGTSLDEVTTATVPVTTTAANSYEPGTLDYGLTYYWRIDEYDGWTLHKGSIWRFKTAKTSEPGLISWWQFDETSGTIAGDSAGYHPGALINGPVWTTGQIDGGLDFDGTDDYVDLGTDPLSALEIGTISAWIKSDIVTGFVSILTAKQGTDGYDYLLFRTSDGKINLSCRSGSTYVLVATGSTVMQTGQWYQVAYTVDTNSNKLYVNGSPETITYMYGIASSKVFFKSIPAGQVTSIGVLRNLNNSSIQYFSGTMDDVRVYNRALSPAEVQQLYEDGF